MKNTIVSVFVVLLPSCLVFSQNRHVQGHHIYLRNANNFVRTSSDKNMPKMVFRAVKVKNTNKVYMLMPAGEEHVSMHIHPNPAQNTLTIAYSPNSEYATTEITDLQGRILLTTPFKKETDVSSLAPGVYMIRIRDGMSVKTSRFIKE